MGERWPSMKAQRLFAALLRAGWHVVRTEKGSHRVMAHPEHPTLPGQRPPVFSFHDSEEIGHRMMAKLAKRYHLRREDL
jgi:predicted RNA binding protein YcfA (HicA-like mRNA interferase family)